MREGVIYSISCPIHKKIFYVGKTLDFRSRYKAYFSGNGNGTAVDSYIRYLVENNLKPKFTLHKKCSFDSLDNEETEFISELAESGVLLLNCRKNKLDNYNSAREFYLGIEKPTYKIYAEIIDLTGV